MRLFAIGDIHGCASALNELIRIIDLQPGDRLITLGDYLNKGPDTRAVLDTLIQLHQSGYLVPLKGNHELKLLQAVDLGYSSTSPKTLVDAATLNSYAKPFQNGQLNDIPDSHIEFIRNDCLNWYETETHIFVHGTVDANRPLSAQTHQALFWDKLTSPQPHRSGKTVICGHTPQRNGMPLNWEHTICIDTAAAEGRWLTCLNVTSGEIWQANQQRQLNHSWLSLHVERPMACMA